MLSHIVWLCLVFFPLFISLPSTDGWKIESRIVGGSSAVEKQFPYQVSLRDKESGVHFCGAAIISGRFILTAAHCFFDRPLNVDLIYGVVNITHASDFGTRVEFIDIILHPEFGKRSAQPDIGLIKSKDEIKFSEFVSPINLPTSEIQSGVSAVFSGWGSIKPPKSLREAYIPSNRPQTLQFKEVLILTMLECFTEFDALKNNDSEEWRQVTGDLNEMVICTKNQIGMGSCVGDSGSPLVFNGTLIGIISWSVNCSHGYPTVHTKVFPYINWIQNEMDATLRLS